MNKRQFQTPKNTSPWQKDQLSDIGKRVTLHHYMGGKITTYKNCKILNVDIKTGNRYKILTDKGEKLRLIGGNFVIIELDELSIMKTLGKII